MSINTKDWKTMKLGDILSEEQIKRTVEILNACGADIDKTKALKQYYGEFKEELIKRGFDSNFLAYAVPFWIEKERAANN